MRKYMHGILQYFLSILMSTCYGVLPFLGMQWKCDTEGTIIRLYYTVQIFQVVISLSHHLFLMFAKTDHGIKD